MQETAGPNSTGRDVPPVPEPGRPLEIRDASRDERLTAGTIAGGSSLEVLAGAGAIVLAIIGLIGYYPFYMASIATIAVGAALLVYGGAIAARWSDTVRRLRRTDEELVAGGVGTEIVGGIAGIILGIIALAGILPFTLLAVAAIVLGGSVLLGGAAQPDVAIFSFDRDPRIERVTRRSVETSGGVMVLVGAAAVVLGILALVQIGPALALATVAMLALGAGLLLAGGATAARFGRRLTQIP
jgi:hypothetical protein